MIQRKYILNKDNIILLKIINHNQIFIFLYIKDLDKHKNCHKLKKKHNTISKN